ncbi:MAG: DUF6176 family protein [Thaumarchaeota archaeon]|nr:DUF6176 family protein [Nitrososphaerota archaeon]
MQTYCGALPVLPGKKELVMQFAKDIMGPMRKDLERSQKHLGIKKEGWFLQSSSQGDWLLMYIEAQDVGKAFGDFAISKDPFEVLLRNQLKEITGIDFSSPPSGAPPAQIAWFGY